MNKSNYKLAGWITMCFLPVYLLFTYVGMLIVAYAFFNLKKLINERYGSMVGDKNLELIYFSYGIFVILSIVAGITGSYDLSIMRSVGISLFIGVNLILFIRKLRIIESDFYGLKKVFIGSLLITGLCYVFSGLGIMLNAVGGAMINVLVLQGLGIGLVILHVLICAIIGLMFLRASEETHAA